MAKLRGLISFGSQIEDSTAYSVTVHTGYRPAQSAHLHPNSGHATAGRTWPVRRLNGILFSA